MIQVAAIIYTEDQNEPSIPFTLQLECSNEQEFREAIMKAARNNLLGPEYSDEELEELEYQFGPYGPMVETGESSLIIAYTQELRNIGVQGPDNMLQPS